MNWLQEALALWQNERKDLYAAGYLSQDMKRTKEAIERLNKEIEDEDNRSAAVANRP